MLRPQGNWDQVDTTSVLHTSPLDDPGLDDRGVSILAFVVMLAVQWLPPVPGAEVTQEYSAPAHAWAPGHRGVDYLAALHTPVQSIGPGEVVFVGRVAGKPVVSINHPDLGLRSTYEPVDAVVHLGEEVTTGTLIGFTADVGGHCAMTCVHLGLKANDSKQYQDPQRLFGSDFAVLRPLSG